MGSKYLNSLSKSDYDALKEKLHSIQNHKCFICEEEISLELHSTDVDHIIPLANKGKDNEDNFALTHESCNRSKQDADLKIAKLLHKLKKIQNESLANEKKAASLKQVLQHYNGSKYDFKFKVVGDKLEYSFSDIGDNTIYETEIHSDFLSKEKTCFIHLPLEYIYHDELINPRGINNSISLLIKEFDKKNPQLHLSIGRIENGKVKIFDGQHKAVAQVLLGSKKLLLRIFISPDIDRLTETNTNAGSSLRQIAFDKSIMRQLNNTLYHERIKKYQEDHKLDADDFSFSEQKLIDYFRGENVNIKKYIVDSIKHSITDSQENRLKDYIDREGKSKEVPISYSAFDKSFLAIFIDSKRFLSSPINDKSEEGLNPRELEISQIINLLNIIAKEIYVNKFSPEIGVARIEDKIIKHNDDDITDEHLIAYRISKEEIMYNWLVFVKYVIKNYFSNNGVMYDESSLFQQKFDEQLWMNIKNFICNLKNLPLWKDRAMANTIFSGKNTYDYWKTIFTTGKTVDNVPVLSKPINYVEMIR